jgi:hypothetical protein
MNELIKSLENAKQALEAASASFRTLLLCKKIQELESFNQRALTQQYLQQAYLYSQNSFEVVRDLLDRLTKTTVVQTDSTSNPNQTANK